MKADLLSTEIFSALFEALAKEPQDERTQALAKKVWKMRKKYSFRPHELKADPALVMLGLAKTTVDPQDPRRRSTLYASFSGAL